MQKSLKQAIEDMGAQVVVPLSELSAPQTTRRGSKHPADPPYSGSRLVKEQALPIAEVQDQFGKEGVAYVWNTGELQLTWM